MLSKRAYYWPMDVHDRCIIMKSTSTNILIVSTEISNFTFYNLFFVIYFYVLQQTQNYLPTKNNKIIAKHCLKPLVYTNTMHVKLTFSANTTK